LQRDNQRQALQLRLLFLLIRLLPHALQAVAP
jgi:hypothetical protein